MKKVKHPLVNIDLNQDNFLEMIGEESKEYHTLLFSYGNAAYLYHSLPIEPSKEDFNEWLEGLPEHNFKRDIQQKGFEACKTILSFTRYVREKNDIGMDRFIEDTMGEEQFKKYKLLLSKL